MDDLTLSRGWTGARPVTLSPDGLVRMRRKLGTVRDLQELVAFRDGLIAQGLHNGPIAEDIADRMTKFYEADRRKSGGVMAGEFGPWIDHDGYTPLLRVTPGRLVRIEAVYFMPGLIPPKGQIIGPDWPGFYWRWVLVKTGWFRSELRRVCDDPAYAPILRYRVIRPAALALLEQIAARPREAVIA